MRYTRCNKHSCIWLVVYSFRSFRLDKLRSKSVVTAVREESIMGRKAEGLDRNDNTSFISNVIYGSIY